MDNKPVVSVLMTCYNREKYIAAAIKSVLASTYTDFELIIVDDRSTDSTVTIAKELATTDSRIKVYVNEVNLGDYPNRNKAASYAAGKYIKYLDSDDIMYPHGLAVMVNAMEKFPEAAFAFCDWKIQDNSMPYPVFLSAAAALHIHFFKGGLFHSSPSTSIIRMSAFQKAGGFSGKRFIGDYELWLKLAAFAPLVLLQPGLVWWRIHEDQENEMGEFEHYSLKYNLNKAILEDPAFPLTAKEKKEALGNYYRLLGRRVYKRVLLKYGVSKSIQLIKDCRANPVTLLIGAFLPVNKVKKIYRKVTGFTEL